MALLARLNHANDLLAGHVIKTIPTNELDLCASSVPDLKAPPHSMETRSNRLAPTLTLSKWIALYAQAKATTTCV